MAAGCRRYRSEWVERAPCSAQHVHMQQELPLFLLLPTLPPKSGSPQPSCEKSCCHESLSIDFLGGTNEQGQDILSLRAPPHSGTPCLCAIVATENALCVTRGRGGGCSAILALEGPHTQTWVHNQPSRTPSESCAGLFRSTRLLAGKLRAGSSPPCCRNGKRRRVGIGIRGRAGPGQAGVQREAQLRLSPWDAARSFCPSTCGLPLAPLRPQPLPCLSTSGSGAICNALSST